MMFFYSEFQLKWGKLHNVYSEYSAQYKYIIINFIYYNIKFP